MWELDAQKVSCPYCGEQIDILVDPSCESQDYIEDCQVCCRPIEFQVQVDDGNLSVVVRHENE